MIKDLFEVIQKNNHPAEADMDEAQKLESRKKAANAMPAGIMAYMGDGVYEMVVRNFFVQRGLWDSQKIHRTVIKFVNAGAQATILRHLEEVLTEEEIAIMKRARNSNAGNVPRNAKVSDYRYSTAFEAVLGYVLLKGDMKRLEELIQVIEKYLHEQISGK